MGKAARGVRRMAEGSSCNTLQEDCTNAEDASMSKVPQIRQSLAH